MKKIVTVQEVEGEGFESFLGNKITIYCFGFIYTGVLGGVGKTFLKLKDPMIVYDTGPHDILTWENAQPMPKNEWYVMISAIESFGDFK